MKIEQEIMEMFDKEFVDCTFEGADDELDYIISPKTWSSAYCKDIKSFISEIITLVQKNERERIIKDIRSEEWFELNADADYIINEIINKD